MSNSRGSPRALGIHGRMSDRLLQLFRKAESPKERGKFLSRVFGIFSEDIVRLWAADKRAPYKDLGRPTLQRGIPAQRHTLDFTLEETGTGRAFAAELKCEIEYESYRYFLLSNIDQLKHHRLPAFAALLELAKNPTAYEVAVSGKSVPMQGAILIWGAATAEGKLAVREHYGFFDVLTMDEIIADLCHWNHEGYRKLVESRRCWSNELCDGLLAMKSDA